VELADPGHADRGEHAHRFESLHPGRTGIDFAHRWTPPPEYEYQITGNFAGGGAAIGDYDADGRPDLYLTRPFGGDRLYRNLGDFRFEDATETAGCAESDAWGTGASFADIDNDGDLDLYVCRFDSPNHLYIN
jgi:hypothetical protein